MKANHIPRAERLRQRLWKLERRRDENHVPSPTKGNPYYHCKACGVYDPELSIRRGKHYGNCPMQGIENEIRYYQNLLREEESRGNVR